jgi:hypothetical protein
MFRVRLWPSRDNVESARRLRTQRGQIGEQQLIGKQASALTDASAACYGTDARSPLDAELSKAFSSAAQLGPVKPFLAYPNQIAATGTFFALHAIVSERFARKSVRLEFAP